MAGLSILRRLLMKQAVKESGQASGILSIGSDVRKIAMNKYAKFVDSAKRQGVDLDKLSEQEIKYMLELNKPKAPKVYSNEEAYEILNRFANKNKRGEVIKGKFGKSFSQEVDDIADKKLIEQMYRTSGPRSLDEDAGYLAEFIAEDAGKVLDDLPIEEQTKFIERAKNALRKNVKQYQPPETEIIEGVQTTKGLGDLFGRQLEKKVTVQTVIEDIKKLEPIESMKETNRVLRGEGKYKNLSKADREKIAGDESVTDHIFERNIIDETEDFAYGGVAGMLGEPTYQDEDHRVPYDDGGSISNVLPADFDELDPEELIYIIKLLKAGEIPQYALGGRVPLAGGKLVKDLGLKFLNKIFGKDRMIEMRTQDPEMYQGLLEVVDKFRARDKTGLIKYMKKYLPHMDDAEIEDFITASDTGDIYGQLIRLGSGRDYKGKIEMIKKLEKANMLKNFDVTGRKPNATGGRIGFSEGKGPKMSRRTFLKGLGALAALPVVGKFFKFAKPAAKVADLTQVPIENAKGMPSWFKPLVNRVIKEGVETTKLAPNKGGAYLNRQIVHSAKLGEGQGVRVYQNLDDQTINVEYQSIDNLGGVDDGIVNLEYRAPQDIYDTGPAHVFSKEYQAKKKAAGGTQYRGKSAAEFEAHEAYPYQDPKDYKTVTFEGDNIVKNVNDLHSDTSALKQFATGKDLTKKELAIAKQKKSNVKKINEDPWEELAGSGPDYDPYASGGRVSFKWGGKGKVLEGLAKLMDEFFPGTTKIGQRSKPYPEKVQETMDLRKAIAEFQERENVIIDGKKYKRSDKDRPPTEEELEDDYAELWDDENSPLDFGSTVRELDAALVDRAEEYKYMYQQYKMGKLDPEAGSVSRARLNLLRKRAEEAENTKDFRLFGEDEADELDYLEDHFAQVDKEESFQFAERARKAKEKAADKQSPWYTDPKTLTPEEELRREFPGISDDLINQILIDDNPQRIAEAKAAMKEALKMQEKGMGVDEIIDIFKKQGKKPTKHASGGLARMLGE